MKQSKGSILTEAQKTVVFTDKQLVAIYDALTGFDPEHVTDAIEEVFQQLLNNSSSLHADLGNPYFILRQLRDFYTKLHPAMQLVYNEYLTIPMETRSEFEHSLKCNL